ncbi:MAG TPA: 3-deoxy-manno-octulosonate cytidylyltransferase [Chitinophagaceae bacterium]|nr:3-deoxy-manno-octulosonate cytidylyltransferase [Chitinophagaceae bacterium]
MSKKIIAMIPARLQASRFPAKLLQFLEGKPVIVRTFEAVKNSHLFDEVYVVCDHDDIRIAIESVGGQVIMSKQFHESGTDRIAEAVQDIACDIIVNIQGDEPFIEKEALNQVIALFENDEVEIASLMMPITEKEKIESPHCVKVVVDKQQRALYFSRNVIPYPQDKTVVAQYYQHIGVYAFKKDTLLKVTDLPQSTLEKIEKLENLRFLENGFKIHLALVHQVGIAIDTPQDFEKAKAYLAAIQ